MVGKYSLLNYRGFGINLKDFSKMDLKLFDGKEIRPGYPASENNDFRRPKYAYVDESYCQIVINSIPNFFILKVLDLLAVYFLKCCTRNKTFQVFCFFVTPAVKIIRTKHIFYAYQLVPGFKI